MGRAPVFLAVGAATVLCALLGFASADPVRLSGYAIDDQVCGDAKHAFPRLRIGMRKGYCAGLVASEDDGLEFPRSIVQVPGHDLFVVADMGGWRPRAGRLLLLDPAQPAGQRIKVLMSALDFPFGLAVGRDNKVYASTASTIFRFDPLAETPKDTVETIVQGLPGRQVVLPDGTKKESVHPLKPFVFDSSGRLYVSIGAPTDACVSASPIRVPCAAGEGPNPFASIWAFTPPPGGVFAALKPGDPNPPRDVYARGLRNSMALAVHPDFPADGAAFLQAENARDLPDPFIPNEEINAIEKGRHYGWPYCYDLSTVSPEFKSFLQQNSPYKNFCNNASAYRRPYSLLSPHAAPLSMFYYGGKRFPELTGKLVIGLHGYRPTGGRVVVYDVDAKGFPVISPPPVRYHVSCAAGPTRVLQVDRNAPVAAAKSTDLITEWHKVNGIRPQGAPVGMTVASDGAIWLVEDKNQTVIRIDTTTSADSNTLPCESRSEAQIDALIGYVQSDSAKRTRLRTIRTNLVEKHCVGCHSDFDLKAGQDATQRDIAVLRFLLSQDGWIYPGDPASGRLHSRLRGLGAENMMPPDGRDLIKAQAYRQLLDTTDLFVSTMVPGQRMRVRPGRVDRKFYNRDGDECGAIPTNAIVVVVDRQSTEKPGFSRIYRPADIFLNGECSDDGGYFLEQNNVVPL